MSKHQQGIIAILAIGLQLLLYFLFISRSLPYPLFVERPEFGGLFLLVYTTVFIGSIVSGTVLGWRYLPLISSYLTGTTLVLCLLIPALMIIGSIFSRLAIDEVIKDVRNVLLIVSTEEVVPAAFWALIGGMCGAFLHMFLKPPMGIVCQRSKFLLNISAALFVTIALFGVASFFADFLIFGGPLIFVGILIGIIVQDKSIVLAGSSQALFGLGIVAWMILTVQGEGAMAIGPILFGAVPISAVLVSIGAFYGKYLRNHFFERVTGSDKREKGFFSGGKNDETF